MNQYRYLCQILYLASQVNSSHILFLDLWPPRSNILSKGQNFTFILDIRRTIEITLEPIEISSPNFMCSSNGQIYTHLLFWPLTSKLKLPVKRSKLDFFFIFFLNFFFIFIFLFSFFIFLFWFFFWFFWVFFIFYFIFIFYLFIYFFFDSFFFFCSLCHILVRRLYKIRRTIEITFEPVWISSPNFILASQVNCTHILSFNLSPPRSNIFSKGQNLTERDTSTNFYDTLAFFEIHHACKVWCNLLKFYCKV